MHFARFRCHPPRSSKDRTYGSTLLVLKDTISSRCADPPIFQIPRRRTRRGFPLTLLTLTHTNFVYSLNCFRVLLDLVHNNYYRPGAENAKFRVPTGALEVLFVSRDEAAVDGGGTDAAISGLKDFVEQYSVPLTVIKESAVYQGSQHVLDLGSGGEIYILFVWEQQTQGHFPYHS